MIEKIIDPEKADFEDPRWWQYFRKVREELSLRDRTQHARDQLMYYMLESCIPDLKPEFFEKSRNKVLELDDRLWRLVFRIKEGEKEEQTSDDALLGLQAEWEKVYGQLSDPETQAKIQRTKKALESAIEVDKANKRAIPEGMKRLEQRRKARAAEREKTSTGRMSFKPRNRKL